MAPPRISIIEIERKRRQLLEENGKRIEEIREGNFRKKNTRYGIELIRDGDRLKTDGPNGKYAGLKSYQHAIVDFYEFKGMILIFNFILLVKDRK